VIFYYIKLIQFLNKDKRTKVKVFLVDLERGVILDDMGNECYFDTGLYAMNKIVQKASNLE
jgi:hypothetical protein